MACRFNTISPGDFADELQHAAHAIVAACRALDRAAERGSAELAERLDGIEGQSDLLLVARRISELAADIEQERAAQ